MVEMKAAVSATETPSTSSFMSYLDTAVLDDQKLITYKSLSKELNVTVNNAKRMLYTFFDARKSANPTLDATFSIGGYVTRKAVPRHIVAVVRGDQLAGGHATKKSLPKYIVAVMRAEQPANAKAMMGPVSFVHVLSVQPKEIKDLASMISIADSASGTIAERIENTKTKSQITCSTIKPRAGRKIEEPKVVKKDTTSSTLPTKPNTATATAQSSTATSKPTGLFSAKAKSSGKSAKQSWAQAQMAAAMSRKPEDKPEKKNTMSKSKSKALKNLEAATAAMTARKPAVKRKPKEEADSWIVADGEESDSESDSADEEEADRAAEGSDDDHDEEVQMSRKRPAVRRGVVEDSSDEEEEEEDEEVVEVKQQEKITKHVPKSSQDSTGQSQPEAEADNKVATEKSHSIAEEEKNQAEDDVSHKVAKATMKPGDCIDLSPVVSQGVNAEDVDTAQLLEGLDDDMDLFMDDVGTNKPDSTKAKKNTVKKHQKGAAEKEEFVPAPKGIEVPPGKKVIKITKQQGKRMITENVIVDDEDYVPPKRQKFNSPKKPQAKSIAKGKKAPKKGQASITSFFKKS